MTVTLEGKPVELVGTPVIAGETLPHFKLTDAAGTKVKTADLIGKVMVISVVPDLHTEICALQTRYFNKAVADNADATIVTISTNTAVDQQNWCGAEGITNLQMLSDEQESFGYAMNLYVPALGVDTRALYVVDAQGKITYAEIVPEIATEPNYEAALAALQTTLAAQ